MFRATMCPSSGELNCIYETLVFFTLYGWLSGLQTRQPPDDGHIVARNMYRSWNKYTKKWCASSWLHLKKITQGRTVNKTQNFASDSLCDASGSLCNASGSLCNASGSLCNASPSTQLLNTVSPEEWTQDERHSYHSWTPPTQPTRDPGAHDLPWQAHKPKKNTRVIFTFTWWTTNLGARLKNKTKWYFSF